MKRFTFTLMLLVCLISVRAQVPAGFSYQAVVRNSSGDIVAGQTVKFRFSIHSDSEAGAVVYREIHSVPTNNFGLANLIVGMGNKVSGTFDPATWGNSNHYLEVELDPDNGTTFFHLGTTQLLSVPYAFHAKTVENETDGDPSNEIQHLNLSGTVLSLTGSDSTVVLPSSGGGDNWGTDYVHTDETLSGQGTTSSDLKIAQQSATTGQVLKWNGTTWIPANDEQGSEALSLPFSGSTSSTEALIDVLNLGSGHGILGKTGSEDGSGIRGEATSTTGAGFGVSGSSGSVFGRGISGVAWSSTGINFGVVGDSRSPDGTGVYGFNTSLTGSPSGVKGIVESATGYSGNFSGGRFYIGSKVGIFEYIPDAELDINGKIKIRGGNPGTGKVLTSDADGLATWQTASGGFTLPYEWSGTSDDAAFTINQSGTGSGIYVYNPNTTADITCISAHTNSSSGTGISGYAHSETGSGIGIQGGTSSPGGIGVKGNSNATSGVSYGIVGESSSVEGVGVWGNNTSTTGITYGVQGKVSSPSGYSGYFIGGRFVVMSDVGIGSSFPSAKLEVAGQVKITGGSPGLGKILTSDANGLATWENPFTSPWITSGSNIYYNSGNIGIGTSSPAEKLVVSGNLSFTGGTDRYITLPDGTKSLFIGGNKVDPAAYAVHIITNNANGGLSVISDKVGVGINSPSQKLDVNGNARIRSIGSGAYAGVVNRTSDGTFTTATSDERLKENIHSLQNSLDKIMKLRGVSFSWKTNPEYGTRIGFIAQEFEKVIPELVFTNPTDGYKGINYAEVSAVIVEAVKEQQKLIEELKTENDRLKAENEGISTRLEKIESILNLSVQK